MDVRVLMMMTTRRPLQSPILTLFVINLCGLAKAISSKWLKQTEIAARTAYSARWTINHNFIAVKMKIGSIVNHWLRANVSRQVITSSLCWEACSLAHVQHSTNFTHCSLLRMRQRVTALEIDCGARPTWLRWHSCCVAYWLFIDNNNLNVFILRRARRISMRFY